VAEAHGWITQPVVVSIQVVLELVLQDLPSLVILLLQAVQAAGMIMALAAAKPATPAQAPAQGALMYQPQVAAAAGTGILLPAPAVPAGQLQPEAQRQGQLHPAHAPRDTIGCLTTVAGACLTAQAVRLQIPHQLQPHPPPVHVRQDLTG
jgi:cobalamin synthase